MTHLSTGARQLSLRHLSIRIPWNDTDWTGRVCCKPGDNVSCLILPRIRETRDDSKETMLAGHSWQDLDGGQFPACVSERGAFMAPYSYSRMLSHPYSKTSQAHGHFLPTPFRYPSYAAPCIPFNWMLKEGYAEKVKALELGFVPELEQQAHEAMGFETNWVQTKHNQLVMLDTFFSALQPQKSLCFFYAKRTPLVDDPRRVLIGAGWVAHVGEAVEYLYSEKKQHDSVIWERAVQHSIRPDFKDGFLLPYHAVLAYLNEHPDEDPAPYVAFVPDDQFWSFSFTSEHVTNDGAIASLLACAKALENIARIVPGPWERVRSWIDARINELWRMRGPCPGLGSALTAFGIANGTLLANELELRLAGRDDLDPWPLADGLLRQPEAQPPELKRYVSKTTSLKWQSLPDERRKLLKLLSRFELTPAQATRYYVPEDKARAELRIKAADAELIANPYLLYELDRVAPDPIGLATVDRGLYPDATVRERYPIPAPSRLEDATDPRRVRAFVVRELEEAAAQGHTLLPRALVISQIRERDVQPPCPVDGDLMAVVEPAFGTVVRSVQMAEQQPAYQLDRLSTMGEKIRSTVNRRLIGKRHIAAIPWRQQLDDLFKGPAAADDQDEQLARAEKAAALEELFASRFSVLIGPAGTGKTTLLRVLCEEPTVKAGGILLLAPTGKARVRMEEQTGVKGAQTIAQFLLPLDRYQPDTGAYRLSDREGEKGRQTVIIDESSMLTEEQLAAVLDALSGVQRLILVGDPRQLPPIGAGRPFLDIVRRLEPQDIAARFPRVAPGYTELTIRRRQTGTARDDLLLAEWFSGRPVDAGADEIWSRIESGDVSDYLSFVRWDSPDQLPDILLDVLVTELKLGSRSDAIRFEEQLGGSPYQGSVYFWEGKEGKPGACAKAGDWQILSPVRGEPYGVEAVNRLIQRTFRSRTKEFATSRWRKIPKPMGREEILYGDKVINVQNHRHGDVWPKEGALHYIANGEIGIVVGQYKTKYLKSLPWKLEVEFSSQPSFKYGYGEGYFGEESQPMLELAYALTIHKAQGSEFGRTILVIPNPCRLLSRELLYTALTRQQNRVVILHQGDRHDLMNLSVDHHSEAARRLTNLFVEPKPVQLQERFLEDGLIHKTRRGDSVRSKSEVIIADLLYSKGIDYKYEAPFIGSDGSRRYPDFAFEDAELGLQIYWEHLGMMQQPDYRRRWEAKLAWYRAQGVLPYVDGGGPNGTLIITQDDAQGGIQSNEIERLVAQVLGR